MIGRHGLSRVASALLLVAALSAPAWAVAETSVSFGTFSIAIDYSPYLVAKKKGWFDQALAPFHAKASFTQFETLPTINEALASDRLDVIFEAEPPIIIAKAAGIDVHVVDLDCTLPVDILVPTSSPVRGIAGLKGKTVAVLAGTSSQYGVLADASAAGVDGKDIEMVDMAPPEAKAAFDSGRVDAWAIWPPWVEEEIVAGRGHTLSGGRATIQSIMAMRDGFVNANPAMARAIIQVVERAKAWVTAHPDEAIAIVSEEAEIDPKVVKLAWPKHDFAVRITPEITADIQRKSDFLFDKRLIRVRVDVAKDLVRQ